MTRIVENRVQKFFTLITALVTLALAASGCAQIMGSLRRDLDDQPFGNDATVGGKWADHGFLAEDLPEGGTVNDRYVGHSERNPASESGEGKQGSWVDSDQASSNRRDAFRGVGDDDVNSGNMSSLEPNVKRQYKNGSRATRADFLDESQNEGSLWASDGQTNYYLTKNRVRGVGDIITVVAEEGLVKDIAMDSRRSLTPGERDFELMAAQERLRAKANGTGTGDEKKDQVASSAAAPGRGPASANGKQTEAPEVNVPSATYADVDMTKSLELKPNDTLMGEIIERYPNGNYKIRASKKIPYKGGAPRFVSLVGVVKGSDIGDDDTVTSGKLYEYRVESNR